MMNCPLLQRAAERLANARRVCALTGAGVSAESGVPTFRGVDGLWNSYKPEEVSNPYTFARDPAMVWEWYNMRRNGLMTVAPNPGHDALVELEQRKPGFCLITQNVDGLHQAAGSRNVLEIHGNIWWTRCTQCRRRDNRFGVRLTALPTCAECGQPVRPDVVWFGESLPMSIWEQAVAAAVHCDLFVIAGTSAAVYPAASLLDDTAGAFKIEVNLEPTPASGRVDVSLLGPSGKILPELVRLAFGK